MAEWAEMMDGCFDVDREEQGGSGGNYGGEDGEGYDKVVAMA